MKLIDDIKNKTLLIIPNDFKEKMLEIINNYDRLINVKLMTFNEFLDHYFYSYDEKTILYVMNKYNLIYKNSKMYLDNMKYVLNLDSNNKKIKFLNDMYYDLINNNLLNVDYYFKEYLKSVSIKVLEIDKLEEFYLKIFNNYKVEIINLEERDVTIPNIYHFKTIEEECNFLFNEISSLVKKGVSLNKIKLINVTLEYIPYLKRFSKFYNIPIYGLLKNSLIGTLASSKIISMIKNNSKEEIDLFLNKNLDKDVYKSIFNILNKYAFVDNLNDVLDLIEEDFRNTYLKDIKLNEEIEIIPLNSYLVGEYEYAFLMGFNLEHFPKTYKDIDYLDDSIKEEIGLFTSLEKNKEEINKSLFHIKNIPNLIITYKDTDPYKTYLPSNLIEDLKEPLEIKSINQTSNLYNQIKLTEELDNVLKYGTTINDLRLLNTYYDIPYLTYDNKYKKIDYKENNIILSYTSLNNFYHCSFKYYIENILKLNVYEDTFKIYIGNLFHFVLSKIFDKDFDLDSVWNSYIKDRNFNKKEEFYLEILKEELIKIIEIIKNQHDLSGFNDSKLETCINLEYGNNTFKGIIDKIMYKEKDNTTLISIVDYKTGTPKTDMTNLLYGIDMQLPVYAYLVKKGNLFLNPKIVGFYFQKIINEVPLFDKKKTIDEIRFEKLKLNGYTLLDETLISIFDSTYEDSEMIKGMKVTKNGFSHYTKLLTSKGIDRLVDIVDLKIKEAFKEIENANFTINPKVIEGKLIGCSFCKYQDLCFKTGSDLVYLENHQDLSYLETSEDLR